MTWPGGIRSTASRTRAAYSGRSSSTGATLARLPRRGVRTLEWSPPGDDQGLPDTLERAMSPTRLAAAAVLLAVGLSACSAPAKGDNVAATAVEKQICG